MSASRTMDDAIGALYRTVSGPAGEERNWDAVAPYLHPNLRLIRTGVREDGSPFSDVMGRNEYIESSREFFRSEPFYEVEVARETLEFGNIAHAWSTYEARRDPGDATPFKRGINSIQLFFDGEGWRILSVIWDNERDGNPLL